MIRGYNPSEPLPKELKEVVKDETTVGHRPSRMDLRESRLAGPAKVVVVIDTQDLEDVVIVGVNVNDRPGLLLDISRGLHSLGLQLHHTEAAVILNRSISVWRCALIEDDGRHPDAAEMKAVLQSMLENEGENAAAKRRGLSVIHAILTDDSRWMSCQKSHLLLATSWCYKLMTRHS